MLFYLNYKLMKMESLRLVVMCARCRSSLYERGGRILPTMQHLSIVSRELTLVYKQNGISNKNQHYHVDSLSHEGD